MVIAKKQYQMQHSSPAGECFVHVLWLIKQLRSWKWHDCVVQVKLGAEFKQTRSNLFRYATHIAPFQDGRHLP